MTMEVIPMSSPKPRFVRVGSDLPHPVQAYLTACNSFDLAGLAAAFADDALVNDQQREYAGPDAIRSWAAREIIGDRVTMEVTRTEIRSDNIAITATIDGDYDKTGLPCPLNLTFYFSVAGDRISQLIILRNKGEQVRTSLALDHPLGAYFAAKNRQDVGAMLACFAADAIVVDESRQRRGEAAIRQWIEDSTAKYRVTVEPLSVNEYDGGAVVAGLVSGNFSGSPVKLRYTFALSNACIARLEIAA
jgi:ketosteroid isomerase-like protein